MLPFRYKCQYCGNIQAETNTRDIMICNKCGKVDIKLDSIDLYYVKPYDIVRLLRADLERRKKRKRPTVKLLWMNNKGKRVEISKCNPQHVENIIKMVSKLVTF